MRHTADATCVSNWMLLREALSSQNAPFANLLRSGPGGRAGVAFSSFFSSRLAAAPVKMARATGVNFDVVGRRTLRGPPNAADLDAHVPSGAVRQRAGSAGLPRCLQLLLKKTGSEDAAVKFAWWYVDTYTGRTTASEAWGSAPVSIKRST